MVHFHIHILFCIKGLKNCPNVWLLIPEGKPIWQVKILERVVITRTMIKTKTIQTCGKTSHCESRWQNNANWLDFKTGKCFLAVGQVIFKFIYTYC